MEDLNHQGLDVDTTFEFASSPPATGAFIFTFWFIADAGIALVVQGIVNFETWVVHVLGFGN